MIRMFQLPMKRKGFAWMTHNHVGNDKLATSIVCFTFEKKLQYDLIKFPN